MSSLLSECLYEIRQQAAPPCKDYHQLTVTQTQVVFKVWRVSCPLRHEKPQPAESKKSHTDFLQDSHAQGHIGRVFGPHTLDYVVNLCWHRYDYLVRLPDWLLLNILSFLEWADIKNISQTCKRLQQLCCSEGFWAQGTAGARYGQSEVTMEGVSPTLQRRLVVFHRRQVLSRLAQQQQQHSKRNSVWHL
uniref:F-box only protein 36-like n=1 Tax=Oncorhynchus gorbuscha TaxID=8017 RepID=UPI001EAF3739|nr:F-box only protein 36-like [Oncorhynchus gorbuscha]